MPSRISGACNGCRTKKQKCSGDRAGCSQCAAAGIVCTWPEQRKRGPAKGYIEGLEHRLHEAETLLLQVLPLISPDQLASAANAANNVSQHSLSRDSPDRPSNSANNNRSSPPILNKKTGIDYWENFPLDTVDNIRRWQQDCALHSHFKDDIVTNHRSGSSRPSSVDVSDLSNSHSRKSSQQQFRSMSTDSATYHGSGTDYNGITPARYNGAPPNTTAAFGGMQTQPAFAGDAAQQWQQQQQQQQQSGMSSRMASHPGMHQHQHHQHHPHHQQSPPQMVAAGGPMDVDGNGGFFSGEVKRHLFW